MYDRFNSSQQSKTYGKLGFSFLRDCCTDSWIHIEANFKVTGFKETYDGNFTIGLCHIR